MLIWISVQDWKVKDKTAETIPPSFAVIPETAALVPIALFNEISVT